MSIPHLHFTTEGRTQTKNETQKIVAIAVTVSTGSEKGSGGTDADVYFKVGANSFPMDTPGYNDFEQGDTDTYYFKTDMTLGQLRNSYIELGHDDSGNKPGWYVDNVVLEVQFSNSAPMVLYKRWGGIGWLAKDEPPYFTTVAELQHAPEV